MDKEKSHLWLLSFKNINNVPFPNRKPMTVAIRPRNQSDYKQPIKKKVIRRTVLLKNVAFTSKKKKKNFEKRWYNFTIYLIGISGSLIWSKALMELIFNSCGEFRWSPEDPVSQIHSPHLHVDAPGIFSDFLRSVQMLKREWGAESNGKLSQPCFPSLCLPQNCSLDSCVCSEGLALRQNTLMMISQKTNSKFFLFRRSPK